MCKILFMLNQFLGPDWTNRQINELFDVFICFSRNHTSYPKHTKKHWHLIHFHEWMHPGINTSAQVDGKSRFISNSTATKKNRRGKKTQKFVCFVVVCCGEMNETMDDGQRFYKLQTEKRFKRTKWKCRMEMSMKMRRTITWLRDWGPRTNHLHQSKWYNCEKLIGSVYGWLYALIQNMNTNTNMDLKFEFILCLVSAFWISGSNVANILVNIK